MFLNHDLLKVAVVDIGDMCNVPLIITLVCKNLNEADL